MKSVPAMVTNGSAQLDGPFAERFLALSQRRGPLCVGIDPSPSTLRAWSLEDNVSGLRQFCDRMLEAAAEKFAIIKPQAAFFERYGPEGMVELRRVSNLIKEQGSLVLIDAKRGDISSTAAAYGEAYLGPASAFGADAITLHPFLGFRALSPILDIAARRNAGVFVVVRSSNPEGSNVQLAKDASGRTVSEIIADEITEYNETLGDQIGLAGAVVGATLGDEVPTIAARLPKSLLLAPGIGMQGATLRETQMLFGAHYIRTIPSISRDIAMAGPSREGLASRMHQYGTAAPLNSSR